jgi:hypothetical protein
VVRVKDKKSPPDLLDTLNFARGALRTTISGTISETKNLGAKTMQCAAAVGASSIGVTTKSLANSLSSMTNRTNTTDRLRHAAWKELHVREEATVRLMGRIQAARMRQLELLRQAAKLQARQLMQLEEISTELWNAWQMSSELFD